jgi:hypothetical protein
MRRIDHVHTASYFELYDWLAPRELLDDPPADWIEDWQAASPDSFLRQTKGRPE